MAARKNKNNKRKKLLRSKQNRMLSGILAGIAEYIGMDPTLLRISFLISMTITGIVPGVLLYLIATVALPQAKR